MELKEPRRKTRSKGKPAPWLSLFDLKNKISAYFNEFSVLITDAESMQQLHSKGCFGKANLSRSHPTRLKHTEVVRKRVYNRRKLWGSNDTQGTKKIIVIPDSDADDDYFVNLKSEYCVDNSSLREVLSVSLEEAYFLSVSVKCLNIHRQDKLLDANTAWDFFNETDAYFSQNYPVYHHFRSKNWVVKPGLKFGGDYLLYKDGPAFYHASYLVIIDVLDQTTLQRRHNMVRRSMEAANMIALNRLCETVGKELLICQILWPKEITNLGAEDLHKLSISEVIMRRWILSENRVSND